MRALVVLAVLLAWPATAGARVIRAESVLPPGQSGTVPQTGDNPHLADQVARFEAFRLKPAGFDQPGTTEAPAAGITITRDAYGVPSVRATNDRRLWTGVGYAIAQDRLVQLELFRRSTTGTLAAVLGRGSLESDVAARRDYYTERERRQMLGRLPAPLRARFYAYATGINLWLARLRADPSLRPAELVALALDPADWGATDLAAIGIQIARTTPSDDGRELQNWQALRALGARRFDRLLPLRRAGQVASVPASEGRYPSNPGRTRRDERIGYRRSRGFLAGVRAPAPPAQATALVRGGSNAWAIRQGRRSWLFNGPQLGFDIPSRLVELEVHRPGLDARGVTVPGLPVVGIGRNAHIAWGLTSGASDEDDLYVERLVSRERYRYKGRVRRMRCRTETFAVARAAAERRRLCRTVHGPVQTRSPGYAFARRYATWNREVDTLVGLAGLNEAHTVAEAGRALANVSWNENTLVADDRGNLGFWHPGLLPLRPRRWDERLPLPGDGRAEWRGFLSVRQRPHVVNPRRGWLTSWNNVPSVGWTVGDAPDPARIAGPLHRGGYLDLVVRRRQARRMSFTALKRIDRRVGTIAQQRPLLQERLADVDRGLSGGAGDVLERIRAWDGSYHAVDRATNTVDPGVAAWEALKDAAVRRLPRAARTWLGAPSVDHQFDFGGADATAFLTLSNRGLRRAAAEAARALAARFGSTAPASWREPRRMYEVEPLGLAPAPALRFYDRGTWQQAVELGPGS